MPAIAMHPAEAPRRGAWRARGPCLAAACLLLAILAGCTDLRVAARPVEPGFTLPQSGAYRFARVPLSGVAGASALSRAGDAGAREAIAQALAVRGLHPAAPDEAAVLVVDFTLRDGIAANVRRLDGPSDYRRSWYNGVLDDPIRGDGTGAMDHTAADSAFRRELGLTVLLRREAQQTVAWEGLVSRSVAPDYPDESLGVVLGRMCDRLFRELP
jgi:hypothetical protein